MLATRALQRPEEQVSLSTSQKARSYRFGCDASQRRLSFRKWGEGPSARDVDVVLLTGPSGGVSWGLSQLWCAVLSCAVVSDSVTL